ncbi:hypothetical protein GCM10011487_61750 [Steroidobacter agaridevorans]|uniref:Uncharacterized protein n=1 Tax=Steroidobacter agaridevorans TaxID=2695856 RepID=A0A829YLJ6_9GAMM|nr:hypothetical protein [Steroidobacter agaridevorans]GFE84175.1 hypothetical protein GCM10011487_61750 [Steroidobacter agaridevorans]GFE86997.1 hypothetical protein GCM10011488_19510 [Steroidobacter agaridevorans]
MFPRGWPGLALILLRASVATALLMDACGQRQSLSTWIQGMAIVVALTLLAGWATPLSALLALAIHGLIWFVAGLDRPAFVAVVTIDALALALLGPGAYSIDSYRYGHRIVVLPPPS